jgi:hypothetical protein
MTDGLPDICERRAALLRWLADWPGLSAFARETLTACAALFEARAGILRRSG